MAPARIGIDMPEIERLERALERRPGLAERLFTDAEREYATGQAPPGHAGGATVSLTHTRTTAAAAALVA